MTNTSIAPDTRTRSRKIPVADRDLLWRLSAFRCSYPNCQKELYRKGEAGDRHANIGEMAHIFAHSKNGPRPNPDGFSEDTNKYENLILLCREHHTIVDVQTNKYTVKQLQHMKLDHERWVADRLATEDFNSADLESIIRWLSNNSELPPGDFLLIPPRHKISKNGFSAGIQKHLNVGFPRTHEVKTYVMHRASLEPDFEARLLNAMLTQYHDYKKTSISSNHLFVDMVQFACGNSRDHVKWLAGIVLVVYFFERCEIFEK
ncbi:MAG: hypothetical protein OXE46_12500 [Chloroflexi bacterium]|nr:hypothetical protein [Chloroflexota bacterium]